MSTNVTAPSRWRTCLALALSVYLLGACTEDGRIVAPRARQLTPAAGAPAAVINPEASLRGTVSIHLYGPYGVSSDAEAIPIAKVVHSDVTASIHALRNWHGGMYVVEVTSACTRINATICSTWDNIPNFCSVNPDYPDEGAPGAEGSATGYMTAQWGNLTLQTSALTTRSCPSLAASSGGAGSGSGPGAGGAVCYEAWYVWADGSQPDQFIGIVCFGGGGGGGANET